MVNIEKQITDLLKQLNDSQVISDTEYKKLKPRGSRFGILYGICKIHKSLSDSCPPFHPILSAIKTPSYNIAKYLVPIFEPITTNKFTIKNSFGFAKEVIEQDSGLYIASLDVESLFTNIPLKETIFLAILFLVMKLKQIISTETILKNSLEWLYKITSSILMVKSINKLVE